MSVKLTTNLSQRLVLTPQLRQRIEMLQMTSLELGDLIQQQLLENPILEEVQSQDEKRELEKEILDQLAGSIDDAPSVEAVAPESLNGAASNGTGDLAVAESFEAPETFESAETFEANERPDEFGDVAEPGENTGDAFEEIDFGREFQDYLDPGYKTQEYEYKEDAPTFEQFLTRAPSLAEHLEWQLHMTQVTEDLVAVCECVIGNLDGDGRLNATNEEVAALSGCSPERVEEARQLVLHLDPVGCGARDARECLRVQLKALGPDACPRGAERCIAERLICPEISLSDLQQHKLPNLAKQLGVEVVELVEELQHIRMLDPYPGRRYSSDEPILIVPEVFIEKVDDVYEIYFADDGGPRLRISRDMQHMLSREGTTKETKDFIKEKMRSAVDLLRNIEHRRQTIYRVVECIVRRQSEFLDKGVQFIKPMMLKDVAEDTGMHLSTISRVVNRKYAHTPQGVIELRRFFTEGMLNEEGEEVSTRIIKLRIKKLIEEEDSHNPITDDQVVKILVKEGIKLSRRTVAKYRDQMSIPGSRERKAVV